jgi:hypothetical protein
MVYVAGIYQTQVGRLKQLVIGQAGAWFEDKMETR